MKLYVMLSGYTHILKSDYFQYLHPVSKEWRSKMINGFFVKDELEKKYFDEVKK